MRRSKVATVSVNGTTLYYEDRGRGAPLLFIHGMCGDARVWADQMARLAPRFHTIAYDRRGHSRSPLGQIKERTVQLHADDAAGLIEELAIAPSILVGSSGGARIALDVVRRYPHLVNGAAVSEPPLFALDPDGAAAFIGQVRPLLDQAAAMGGPKAAVDAFFDFVCPGLWRTLTEAQRDNYRANAAELFGDLQMPPYQVSREELGRIRTRSLIIAGSESAPVLRRIARTLADAIPGSQFVELAGSGHVTYYERPKEFAAAVEAFAATLSLSQD